MAKKTIKAQMMQRRDTKANWESTNPVLLDGEIGIVTDDPNLYKVGNGSSRWNSLPFRGFDGTVVHETGGSATAVMSQAAVSAELQALSETIDTNKTETDTKLTELESDIDNIDADLQTHLTPIRYNDDAFINTSGTTANVLNPTTSSAWRYAKISCKEGDKFTISGSTTSNVVAALYAFVDSSYNIILRGADGDTQYESLYLIAPKNSAYLILNDNKSGSLSYVGKAIREDIKENTNSIVKIEPVAVKANALAFQNRIALVSSLKSESYYGDMGVEVWDNVDSKSAVTAVIPVSEGDVLSIKTNPDVATLLGFLAKFDAPKEGEKINYVGDRMTLSAGIYHPEAYEYIVPKNAAYVAVRIYISEQDCIPHSFIINGYDYARKSVLTTIDELSVKTDINYDNFYIPLLAYGAYIGSNGEIFTNINPPHRGSEKIRVNEGEIYQLSENVKHYLLYDLEGKAITGLKIPPSGKTIKIPETAAYLVLNVEPSQENDYSLIRKGNNMPYFDLGLLSSGSYWGSDGGLLEGVDNPTWRGTYKLKVQPNQFLKSELARFYILYDSENAALTGLKSLPDNHILKIPSNASFIAFDIPHTTSYDAIPVEIFVGSDTKNMQWRSKKWVAFGCSISDTGDADNGNTATGKYAQYLVERSGLIHHNWAWGGSTLSNRALSNSDGKHPTYIQRIDQAISLGVLEDADLITIDGLYNDFGQGYPLGEKTDMTDGENNDSTIYMALYQAITKLSAAAPNAKIVLLSDNTGQEYDGSDYSSYFIVNRANLQQMDYHNAMRDFARYIGVTYIDSGSKSQINNLHPQYLADHIHQSDLGGEVFADAIWAELRNMNPNL